MNRFAEFCQKVGESLKDYMMFVVPLLLLFYAIWLYLRHERLEIMPD